MKENYKEINKLSDNYSRSRGNLLTIIMQCSREGRRVTAKYEERYQVIIPVGRVTSSAYFTPHDRDGRQAKAKEASFDGVLKEQMKALEMEENQTFQVYC